MLRATDEGDQAGAMASREEQAVTTLEARPPAQYQGIAFGQVISFNHVRGFGFIRTTHDVAVFVRSQDLFGEPGVLRSGDVVECLLYQGARGAFAREVVRLGRDAVVLRAWQQVDALRW